MKPKATCSPSIYLGGRYVDGYGYNREKKVSWNVYLFKLSISQKLWVRDLKSIAFFSFFC